MQPTNRFRALLISVALAAAGCNNGCNQSPCSTPLPPSPPIGSNCRTTGFDLALSASPDTGDLQPDYLVRSGTTVNVSAFAFEYYDCLESDGTTSHNVRRPDFSWSLDFVPRGGAKRNVTNLLTPQSMCLTPTFVASRGTWRLTIHLPQHPTIARTITIEAADPDEWVHVGPDGRVLDCASPSCMGRMAGITFDPNRPGILFAAAPGGGIFRSDDDGAWWYPMSDHKIVDGSAKEWAGGLATTSVVALPNSHLVAATCDTDNSFGSPSGCDDAHLFYRSTDLGVTWTQSETGCTDPNEQDVPSGPVLDLVVDSSSSTLYTVANGSVYRSKSEGNCWHRIDPPTSLTNGLGLVAVTVQPLSYIDTIRHFLFVAASPIGGSTTEWSLNQLVFNTSDAEALNPTWTAAAVDAGAQGAINVKNTSSLGRRIRLANGMGSVYALAYVSPDDKPKGIYKTPLFRATVNSAGLPTFSRTKQDPPTSCDDQCNWYNLTLAANDNAPAFVNEVVAAGTQDVVRSIDGGDSWTNLGKAHVDHHFLAFDPSGTRLWSSDDGGVAAIDLPGGTWLDRNLGLNTSLVYRASISGNDPSHAITGIGLQDNGNFIRKARGRIWDRISGCDGFQVTFDATKQLAYEGPANCGRALDRSELLTNAEVNLGAADFFYADPYQQGRVFGVSPRGLSSTLYVANNLDTQNAPPIAWRCADPQPTLMGESILSILILPGDRNRPLVSNSAGDVWRTDLTAIVGSPSCGAADTAGAAVYTTQSTPKSMITNIAIDPADQKSFYAVEARNDAEHVVHLVYNPTNDTWAPTALGQTLPATSLSYSTNRIAVDPRSPSTLYLGTDQGLLRGSSTPGGPWTTVQSVPNTTVTNTMTAAGTSCDAAGIVRVATYGRGVYERFFPTGTFTPTCAAGMPTRQSTAIQVRADGSDGFSYPASSARLRIEYDLPADATDLRIVAMRGETKENAARAVTVHLKQHRGTEIINLAIDAKAVGLIDVDAVTAEALTREGKTLTSTRKPLKIQLRGRGERTLTISTSLVAPGAPLPLNQVELSLGAKKIRTPATFALPQRRGVVLDAPATITLPNGRRASFAGWSGIGRATSDWNTRAAIRGNQMSAHIEFVLDDDSNIDILYRPAEIEREPSKPVHYPNKK